MASPSDNPLKRFIGEIHRRTLWQVLGIYLLASWFVYEVVQSLTEGLGLPDWFPAFAVVFLLLGLPVVLATAFVQEGGPRHESEGVATDPADGVGDGVSNRLFTWRNALLGGLGALVLVGGVAIGAVVFGGAQGPGAEASGGDIEQSVAVLPFVNMSGDPDNEYFSDGITEELLNALAQLPDLRVPARTSSFAFKDQNLPIQVIADTLDVAHVLEGSVRRSGDRVVITAQLVDAQTASSLWSDTYERQLDDIFAIQREIATAIVDQLQVELSVGDRATLVADATESTEAHEAYLRGRYFWNQRTGESLRRAITEFRRATDLDPSYAEAYSGLADSHATVDSYTSMPEERDRRTNLEQGLIASRRAVSLAPDLGMAHTSLADGLYLSGEWERAEQEFELAIELSPGYATAHHWYGLFLFSTGRAAEGVIHTGRAMELDPVSPVISRSVGQALNAADRREAATEQYRKTIELAPNWSPAWVSLSLELLEIGRYDEGLEAWVNGSRLANIDVDVARDAYEAMIRYRETGEPQTLRYSNGDPGTLWPYALSLSGQRDRAIEVFEDYLVRPGAYGLAALLHAAYTSDLLGDDPRYQALLAQAGITW